jgi:putative transposase
LASIFVANISFLGQLDRAYRKEKDGDVKERIFLVRRVRFDGMEASKVAEREVHKSRWWAYKWLKRFDKQGGLEGLKDHPRNGRPPKVSEKKMYKIKQKVVENTSGWEVKQVMNLIYEKTGVRYHEVHVYRLLHIWGLSPKVPQKRFVNIASKEEKEDFKKEYWIYSPSHRSHTDSP